MIPDVSNSAKSDAQTAKSSARTLRKDGLDSCTCQFLDHQPRRPRLSVAERYSLTVEARMSTRRCSTKIKMRMPPIRRRTSGAQSSVDQSELGQNLSERETH